MHSNKWPDALTKTAPDRVQLLLEEFWSVLAELPELLEGREHILAEIITAKLRIIVIEMMLALNGIRMPDETRHLNTYLSASQRRAIEKTLVASQVDRENWIGRAVALVVVYHWYAPQLVDKLALQYPHQQEEETWSQLVARLPTWPRLVTSD